MISRSLLCFGILTLTFSTALAQEAKIAPQQGITKVSPIVHRGELPPAGLVKIFSNLGTGTDLYDDTSGWLVEGPQNPVTGAGQWIANQFTPTANGTVQLIELALQWEGSGTNNAIIALYTDNSGLPGKSIKAWQVQNLPTGGTCCTLVEVRDKTGVPVTAGTHYWVVALTNSSSVTAYNVWDYTWNDKNSTIAFAGTATNNQWTSYFGLGNAMAVYGTQQ